MEYNEEEFLSLSGIQHFSFCRRQWALIHIEQQWNENLRTAEGRIFHSNAHEGLSREKRGNTITVRGLPVFSRTLGINGICDVVEFKQNPRGITLRGEDGKWIVIPVEYKKGSPKEDNSDELQLAAQAVCLEEMLSAEINEAYLYYGETRHRQKVIITEELRRELYGITEEMHKLYKAAYTPRVKTSRKCRACSLNEICLPVLCKSRSAKEYISSRISESEGSPCE